MAGGEKRRAEAGAKCWENGGGAVWGGKKKDSFLRDGEDKFRRPSVLLSAYLERKSRGAFACCASRKKPPKER